MLLSKQYASPWPMRLALAAMLVLAVFAWIFYMERSAFYDLSWHLYNYLKTSSLFVVNRRFVAIATQWAPVLAIRAGLPLDQVLRLYSVVFIGYYLAVFLACAYWMRNHQVALVVVLMFLLFSSRTFYAAQSEFPQALVALLLFYAGVSRQVPVRWKFSTLALALLIPAFVFGHPLCLFAFLFLWGYDWLLNKRFKDWAYYALLAVAMAMTKLRTMLIPPGSYEDTQMTFTPNLIKYFPNYLSLESFDHFWRLCVTDFIALPVLLLVLSVYYIWQRDWFAWLRMGLMWGSVIFFVFVVNVSKPEYTEATYLENIFLPLIFFVGIPFAMELLPAIERRWNGLGVKAITVGLLLGLTALLALVWRRHVPYTAYQQWLNHLMAYTSQFPERKFVMYPDNVDPQRLRAGWPWWATASETMIISAAKHPDSVQTVRVGWDYDELVNAGSKPGVLLASFETVQSSELPAKYVRFPQTIYRGLNTEPPHDTAAVRAYIGAHQQASLKLAQPLPATLRAGKQRHFDVQVIVPEAARPLHSGIRGPHPTLLRTAFYKSHDWPTDVQPTQVALEVDVYKPWTQTLRLQAPHQPGKYTMEVSLISLNFQDWPVKLRIPVEVVK